MRSHGQRCWGEGGGACLLSCLSQSTWLDRPQREEAVISSPLSLLPSPLPRSVHLVMSFSAEKMRFSLGLSRINLLRDGEDLGGDMDATLAAEM